MIHRACIPTHRTAESTTVAGDGSATRHGQRTPVDGKPACVIPARTRSGNRRRGCIPISKIAGRTAPASYGSALLHAQRTQVALTPGRVIPDQTTSAESHVGTAHDSTLISVRA